MKTDKLIAFHGKQEIKDKYVERVKAHAEADTIVKGQYWENGKGCAVGCTIEGSEHERYERELGIPEVLARIEDGLFEGMSNENAKRFPLMFLESIPVGADLSLVFARLTVWEWEDEKHGLKNIKEIADDAELVDCCEQIVTLYKRVIAGEEVSSEEWTALEKLADKIYWARVWARVWARAWAGAWAGAGARARARAWAWARVWARAGVWAGVWAGARAGADFEEQIWITAEKLMELMKEAPVTQNDNDQEGRRA